MFTNAGVKAWHYGDEEYQVIFWGANVDPRSIIYLSKQYDNWCVSEHPTKSRFGKDCVFETENYEDVSSWVIRNWQQYRKVITGW